VLVRDRCGKGRMLDEAHTPQGPPVGCVRAVPVMNAAASRQATTKRIGVSLNREGEEQGHDERRSWPSLRLL